MLKATAVAEASRTPNATGNLIDPNPKDLKQPKITSPLHQQYRVLPTSSSFDSRSNSANPTGRFHMSPEATKLFNTLQQSPLPINSEVNFLKSSYFSIIFLKIHEKFTFFQVYPNDNLGSLSINAGEHSDKKEDKILVSKEKLSDYGCV